MKFYFVGLDIGSRYDSKFVLPHAIEILKESSLIIVEEYKVSKKKLDLLKIDFSDKEIVIYNEHTEKKKSLEQIFNQTILKHEKIAMISDSGYPLFADPGYKVQQFLINYQIPFTVVAGTNSALHGLLLSGMPTKNFYYTGFLPIKEKERKKEIEKLARIKTTLIIMETPYRLYNLLLALKKNFAKSNIAIAFDITEEREEVFRGKLIKAIQKYSEIKKKRNFVLVLDNQSK